MAAGEPFENPLVPNARLEQMLLAMHRLRALEQARPLRHRSGTNGLEACLVAPAIDLDSADVVSDALTGTPIDFLRGRGLSRGVAVRERTRSKPVIADLGAARALVPAAREEDRLWMALGAAAALLPPAKADGRRGAAVCYLRNTKLSPAVLRRAFQVAAEQRLPILFIALPASLTSNRGGPGATGGIAARCGIPSISADRDDAIAIYRVAQESLGRARSGGGPALIECVSFVPQGTLSSRQTTDPLAVIDSYLLERKIVTREWIARQSRMFARQLPQPLH